MQAYNYLKKLNASTYAKLVFVLALTILSNFSFAESWYSYRTGNWNHPDTWTTDPGGTTLKGTFNPQNGDTFTILTGRTVTLTANVMQENLNLIINSGAILQLGVFRFENNLNTFSGQGTLKLIYNVATPNLPTATTNNFRGTNGGTIEYNNSADFTLPATYNTYYSLRINLSTPAIRVTLLHNLTINGNLIVQTGEFRINNNTSPTKLELTVNGDVTVNSSGSIRVGNGSTNPSTTSTGITGGTAPFLNYYENFHRVVLNGNFTNNGTVRFTNLTYPVYNAFPPTGNTATSGAASVYFRGNSDNTLVCNGITDFYTLIVDKGTDQTFELKINSTFYKNFRLFGANNAAGETISGEPVFKKALWIRNGTVRLFGKVVIPSLTEGSEAGTPNSDYYIPSTGGFVIEGPDVIVLTTAVSYLEVNAAYGVTGPSDAAMGINTTGAGAVSLSVYGTLQVNNGYLSTRESGGIIYWGAASGQIIINGGFIDAKQLRTAGSSGGLTAYRQAEGTLRLRGRFTQTINSTTISDTASLKNVPVNTTTRSSIGLQDAVGTFNIDRDDNIFEMTGGTIEVLDVCGVSSGVSRAFEVNSLPAYFNVTGGSIIVKPTTGGGTDYTYDFVSSAPLFNVTIDRVSGTQPVRLTNIPTKAGVTQRLNPPLVVLNNLTLNNNATLNAANYEVQIGGNFNLPTGSTYTPELNLTTFNGPGTQTFTGNGTITSNFFKFKVDKPSGTITLAGTPGSYSVRDSLILAQGTLNDGGKALNVAGHIYVGGTHTGSGKIVMNSSTAAQTIDADVLAISSMGNLEINNTFGVAGSVVVSILSDLTVNSLILTSNRVFYIGAYQLTIGSGGLSGGIFSVNRSIRTTGIASDGGVKRYLSSANNGTTITYPLSCPGGPRNTAINYFPARVFLGTVTTPGFIAITPGANYHPSCETTKQNDALDFYWKTKVSGGLVTGGTRYYEFDYWQNIPNSYNDPYYLIGPTWATAAGNNNSPTLILPASIGLPTGDFTSGKNSPFRNPATYYSRQSGAWNALAGGFYTTWSLTGHTGTAVPSATGLPQNYDNVIIGGVTGTRNDSVTVTANGITAAIITINGSYTADERRPVLNIQSTTGHSIDVIRGDGKFTTTSSAIPNADFGEFLNSDNAAFEYAGGGYDITNSIRTYPNLFITSNAVNATKTLPDANILVRKNLRVSSSSTGNNFRLNGSANARSLTIYGNLEMQNASTLTIQASAGQKTINVYGNINFRYNNTDHINNITATSGAGTTHRLNFYGSTITSGNSRLNFYNAAGTNQMDLYFLSAGNVTVTNSTGAATNFTLNRIYVNKDALNNNVYFQNNFTLGAPTNSTPKALVLNTGTLHLENASTNITLSTGGGNFSIPQTSALILRGGARVQVPPTAGTTGIFLDGLLRAEGASEINIGNGTNDNTHYIEYSGSGNAAIELTGSSILRVNSQIRRSTVQTNGVLKYLQSGDSRTEIYGRGANQTRAKLEVVNSGSQFSMSGNSILSIFRGTGTTFGDLFLRPAGGSVTGGTINIGSSTVGGQLFRFDAEIALNHLNIVSPATANTATIMVNPLVLNGNLNISSNSTLNANGINVSLKGNLTNNGTYSYGAGNITTFNGTTQTIDGSTVTDFYTLRVNPIISLTLIRNQRVNNNLEILSGTLSAGAFNVDVKGNLTNTAIHNSSTGRIILNGINGVQEIRGNGTYSYLEVDNAYGAKLFNNITLTKDFYLTNGIFNINQFLLTLREASNIVGTSFGPSKMIATDGVVSNVGIRKFFNPIASPQNITFPLGLTGSPNKYTPVEASIISSNSGFIRINNIEGHHPATLAPRRVLDYYWEAENTVTNFTGDLKFYYDQSDVVADVADEALYVAARVIVGAGDSWSKAATGPTTDNVNESTNEILFQFTNANELSGEYTAGRGEDIPNLIPIYYSKPGAGDWDNINHWTPVAPAGGPNGFRVVVPSGSTVRTNGNRRFAYRTTIDGRLEVAETYGHNLGVIGGTGTISLEDQTLPAGRFTTFFSCAGGTLEFGGTKSYTIIADRIDTLRNVHFLGSGTKTLPDKDWVICNEFLINGPTVDNASNKQLTIGGTMTRSNGTFLAGSGSGATVRFKGIAAQTLSGFNTSTSSPLYNLEIDNPDGLTLGSQIDFGGDLKLTSGIIKTTNLNILYMLNIGGSKVAIPDGGQTTSYVDGPMKRKVNGGATFIFPVGKGSRWGKLGLITPSNDDWVVEYFNTAYSTLTVTGPLTAVSTTEHWRIIAPNNSTSQATVQLRWDGLSDINPTSVTGGSANIRVAEFNGTNWIEKTSVIDAAGQTARTSANIPIVNTSHPQFYTLGAVTTVTARARFASTANICEGALIPITFSGVLASDLHYEIRYTVNGVGETTVTITSLPYAGIPTAGRPGTYRLTGFRYRVNGTPVVGAWDNSEAVLVNASPSAPTVDNVNNWRCGPGAITLTASGAGAGEDYRWYTAATGGSLLKTGGNTYTTPFLNITTTYYVAKFNITTGCESSRTAIQAVIRPKPQITISGSAEQVCEGEPFTLTVNHTTFLDLYSILITENTVTVVNLTDRTANPYLYTKPNMEWSGTNPGRTYSYSVTVTKDGCSNDPVPNVNVTVWKKPETGPQYHIPNSFGE